MTSLQGQASSERIADIVGRVREKGVRLWSENGQLHFKAPRGVLTHEEIQGLRASRRQIVAHLERALPETPQSGFESNPRSYRAPVTFTQLAHWNLYRLRDRHAIRQIASATRLRGRLNVDALGSSCVEVVRRHDALRTRIVLREGVLVQEVTQPERSELRVIDLTELPMAQRASETIRLIEQLILEPIDVAADSLFAIQLLRVDSDEHVLIVAMEHMISDAYSMGILLRDLFAIYVAKMTGAPLGLPPVSVQFADYGFWQKSAHRTWCKKHRAYWREHLEGCPRTRFPEARRLSAPVALGWGSIPLRIGSGLRAALQEWSRLRHTTLVMCIFTAFVALALRWCEVSEAVISYQIDGRSSPNIEDTIGYFASVLYLRIQLLDDDNFVALLRRVTREYCNAYEHADSAYMEAQLPRPEFTRNCGFNWVPSAREIGLRDLDGSADAIACSAVPFAHPMMRNVERDAEPVVVLYDADGEIVGDLYFPLDRFAVDVMERLGRSFWVFLEALLRNPEGLIPDLPCVG